MRELFALSLHPSRSMPSACIADLPSPAPKQRYRVLPVSSFGADFCLE